MDKNEKKLFKIDKFIILTEKEVQLIEIFLNNKKPISKDQILKFVWNYSSNADTHTVETHIYRLRKKLMINSLIMILFSMIKRDITFEKKK